MKRAERLAAIGRLAAGIAHEIRNPLASVSGSLELLQTAAEASPEDRRLLEIAMREVERLNGLVTNLLGYARPRDPQPLRFDLGELVQEVIAACQRDPVFAEVRFETELGEQGWTVHADPDQLRQVLWNLLRNGAEAMPSGGRLRVGLSEAGPQPGSGTRLSVADTGQGMDPDTQEQIFEPFYSTKDKGTGLGLATVYRIILDHGGQIEADSVPGEGTTITVWLPER